MAHKVYNLFIKKRIVMKKRINLIMFTCLTMTMGLLSCSDDNSDDARVLDDTGKKTFMTVSLTFPKEGTTTRVTSDPNATNNEAEIKTVDVFLYTSNGAYLSRTSLTASDFTQSTSGSTDDKYTYNSVSKIQTSTGDKNVFVGINLPADIATALENKHMSDLSTVAQTMSRTDMTTLANGIPMFSTAGVSSTFVEDDTDPANNVTVTVQRMVAKITVEKSATMIQEGVPGTLGAITFAINNFNLKSFMVQGAASDYKDPNWANGSFLASDFSQAVDADYVPALDLSVNNSPTISDYTACYAAENTSEAKTKKEITRATVRATFIPGVITISDGGSGYTTTTPAALGINAPETFWTVTPSIGSASAYFYDEAVANAYAAANSNANVVEYTNGYCYWDMFLNKPSSTNKWDVLRNDYYKCTITRIVAPGKASPNVYPPDSTPDEDTEITVDINVLFWNTPILADYELEP